MIKCSAVCFYADTNYPIIFTGLRHSDAYERARAMGIGSLQMQGMGRSTVEGFLNDKNQFLDRYDAKFEALKCGQMKAPTDGRELRSEDIW